MLEKEIQSDDMLEKDKFLKELKSLTYESYLFHKDAIMELQGDEPIHPLARDQVELLHKSYPIITPIDLDNVIHLSYSNIKDLTDSFSPNNFMCNTKHGRLFNGTTTMLSTSDKDDEKKHVAVMVKIWDFGYFPIDGALFHTQRIHDELVLLTDSRINSHLSVLKLIGFHCDQRLAVVYEQITPKCFLSQHLLSDEFEWEDRLEVAIRIAEMLMTFHHSNYVHGGITPDCIMLDESLRPISLDFGEFSYHGNPNKYYQPYHFLNNYVDEDEELAYILGNFQT